MQLGRKRQRLGQRGDTIVEVLVSIAVVSMVLGGAYVTTNKSLLATRGAEERGNAVKLVESQLELLKTMVATPEGRAVLQGSPANFCITSPTATAAAGTNACKFDAKGSGNNTTEPVYAIAIDFDSSNDIYTIKNEWNSIEEADKAEVEMAYRIYQ